MPCQTFAWGPARASVAGHKIVTDPSMTRVESFMKTLTAQDRTFKNTSNQNRSLEPSVNFRKRCFPFFFLNNRYVSFNKVHNYKMS